MVTPLPWGSPPLGNPAIRQKYTYRVSLRFLVRPFIRTHCALFHCKKLLVQNQQQRAYNDIGINRFPMGDALHQVGTKVQAVSITHLRFVTLLITIVSEWISVSSLIAIVLDTNGSCATSFNP